MQLAIVAASFVTALASAQSDPLDATDRSAVIDRIGVLLGDFYVFPDVAGRCAERLDELRADGAFEDAMDAEDFSERLTAALQGVSLDKHMRVRPRYVPAAPAGAETERPEHPLHTRARRMNRGRQQNFGFETVTRLEGNIGYVDLRFFAGEREARNTAAAAMAFLANTDALIFDMRKNGGGDPDMVRFLCSYLFDTPTHLNSLYWREGDRTQEFWTIDVPGKKRPDVPVFVLTSASTFSGAEEFSYNLRTQERGTLVGETTGGGANPGRLIAIDEHFEMIVPTGRAINPITGTNWEGTGVEPHLPVAADIALEKARELAAPAAEAYRDARMASWDAFDPWHADARRLDDNGKSNDAARTLTAALHHAHDLGLIHEGDINMYGYEFLGEERHELAIAAFTLNVELYPGSANVYDSLGEACRSAGRIEDAIANYERALELDPDGQNAEAARGILTELRGERSKDPIDAPAGDGW